MSNAKKNLDILTISLNVLYNYFCLTKLLLDLHSAKFFNTLAHKIVISL